MKQKEKLTMQELHDKAVEKTLNDLVGLNERKWKMYYDSIGKSNQKGIDIEARKGDESLYFIVMKMKLNKKGLPFDASKVRKWELAETYYGRLYFVAAIQIGDTEEYEFRYFTPEELWKISSVSSFQFNCAIPKKSTGTPSSQTLLPYDKTSFAKTLGEKVKMMRELMKLSKDLKNLK